MTKDQKYEIAVLADDLEAKRMVLHCHNIANYQTDPEKRRLQAIAYSIAQTEYLEADMKLRRAQSRILGTC